MSTEHTDSAKNNHPDFGQQLGRLNSTSEKLQICICLSVSAVCGLLWFLGVASPFVLVVSCAVVCALLHWLTLSLKFFRTSMSIYEDGIELNLRDQSYPFAYEAVTCISCKHTHHHMNHVYVRSTVEIEFQVEGLSRSLHYRCDYSRGKQSEQIVALVHEKCGEAVQHRLVSQLQREGQVRWKHDVDLTADGLKLIESGNEPRFVHYNEIDAWKIADNNLKIWKTGDAMPCVVMANDTPNFAPLFRLFEKICACVRNKDSQQQMPIVTGEKTPEPQHAVTEKF